MCLLLVCVLLIGCAPKGENIESTAPVTTGAALETLAPVQSADKTEQALARIAQLGSSPDDNYRVFYEIFVYSF